MEEMEDEFMLHEGECVGCGVFHRINDLALCEVCGAKLERDLIRERDWAYSVTAYGLRDEDRESVRRRIVREFGEAPELIAPTRQVKLDRKRRRDRRSR